MIDFISKRFNPAIEAYADFVVRRRWLVLFGSILLFAAGASGARLLQTQTTFRVWHADDDPAVVQYDQMLATFGSDDTALVAFKDPAGVLRNDALMAIDRMTQRFWRIENVKRVDSLTNFNLVKTTVLDQESPAIAISPEYLFAPGESGAIAVFDHAGTRVRTLAGHEGTVEHLVLSPDGKRLVSGAIDRTVIVWDPTIETPGQILRGLPEGASSLVMDERGIYAGSLDTVVAWSPSGARLWTAGGLDGFVTSVIPSTDGTKLYAGSKAVRVLDAATGNVTATWDGPGAVITEMLISADGRTLYTASEDARVLAFDTAEGKAIELVPDADAPVLALALSPDGKTLHAGTQDGRVLAIEIDGARAQGAARAIAVHKDAILDLTAGRDGKVFSGSADRNAAVLGGAGAPVMLAAHRGAVRRVLLSPDESALYTLGDDGAIYVWSLAQDPPKLAGRASRVRIAQAPEAALAVNGEPAAAIEVFNQFRHPIELRIGGESRGIVGAGEMQRVERLPIGGAGDCTSDGECGTGQECDMEELVCASPAIVEAWLPDTQVKIYSGKVYLRRDDVRTVRLPAEDAFAVQEVALSPLPPESRAGAFLAAFPGAKPALAKVLSTEELADPNTFLSPEIASKILDSGVEIPADGRRLLGEISEKRLTANRLPMQPHRLRDVRRLLLRPPGPAAEGFVVNRAADTTLVFVSLHQPDHETALLRMVELEKEMRAFLDQEQPVTGYDYHLSGEIIMDTTFKQYAESDMQKLGPIFAGVCALLLALVFRRPAGVLLPLGAILMAIAFTMGVSGYLGASINNMTGAVPQVVMACCLGDAVHLLTGWLGGVRDGLSAPDATRRSVRENFWACTITMETTVVGFIAMYPSNIQPISTFGWMAAIGAFAAFVFTFTAMPAVLAMLPTKRKATDAIGGESATERVLARWGEVVVRRPRMVVLATLVLTMIGAYGVAGVEFDTNPITSFKEGTPFREGSNFIDQNIAGPVGVEVVLDTGEPRGLRQTKYLEAIAKVQAHLEQQQEVTKVVGLPDIHRSIHRAFNGDDAAAYRLPRTDGEASAFYDAYTLSLPAGMDINNRVSEDEARTRLTVRMRSISSAKATAWQEEMLAWIQTNTPELKPTITGKFLVYAGMTNELTRSFLWNVGSAVVMITLSMMLVLGSLRLGFISMFPNTIPGIWAIGVISLLGVPLDVSIIVSLCVAMGVVVDDTIHFLVKFKAARKVMNVDEALVDTFRHAGLPLSFTTVVLCAGFAIFTASDYQVTSNFGLTTTITFLAGVLLDFTLTPALMKLLDRDKT